MIEWLAQEHISSCVAACLRMVLASFGQQRTEVELRHLLGNPRFGLTLRQAANKLNEEGAIAELNDGWSIDDLRDCLRDGGFPIVRVERRFFGFPSAAHSVVVTAIRSDEVEMLDPLISSPQITKLETFKAAWRSAGQEALVLFSLLPE